MIPKFSRKAWFSKSDDYEVTSFEEGEVLCSLLHFCQWHEEENSLKGDIIVQVI